MDTSTMWLILKLSSINSEEFGYVTYKFFVFYIGSDMTQACLKLQGVHVANADKGAEISDGWWGLPAKDRMLVGCPAFFHI